MRARNVRPNKTELVLEKIINKLTRNSYKYVGDGEVIIGAKCPDFINIKGQKKIIELFGDYWHKRKNMIERDKKRLKIYKQYNYKTLIIWGHELKNIDKLITKIVKFQNL